MSVPSAAASVRNRRDERVGCGVTLADQPNVDQLGSGPFSVRPDGDRATVRLRGEHAHVGLDEGQAVVA
jgi:hypothetical protein